MERKSLKGLKQGGPSRDAAKEAKIEDLATTSSHLAGISRSYLKAAYITYPKPLSRHDASRQCIDNGIYNLTKTSGRHPYKLLTFPICVIH